MNLCLKIILFGKTEGITVTPHLSSITKKYMPRALDIFK